MRTPAVNPAAARRPEDVPVTAPVRPRNDPAQYDDLVGSWWDTGGRFAMLHWISAARARLVPQAARQGSVLVDVACGGGLLAPHVAGQGPPARRGRAVGRRRPRPPASTA